MKIKLLKKGIRVDGKYYPVFYSSFKNSINGNATIYSRSYERFPAEIADLFKLENESDSMTDYFEKDRLRVKPDNSYFNLVNQLAEMK